MTTALEGGEESASRPGRYLPTGKTRYPLYRRLSGPQVRSGQVRKISPPTGIRSSDRSARSQSLYRLRYPTHDLSKLAKNCWKVPIIESWRGGTSYIWQYWKDNGLLPPIKNCSAVLGLTYGAHDTFTIGRESAENLQLFTCQLILLMFPYAESI